MLFLFQTNLIQPPFLREGDRLGGGGMKKGLGKPSPFFILLTVGRSFVIIVLEKRDYDEQNQELSSES